MAKKRILKVSSMLKTYFHKEMVKAGRTFEEAASTENMDAKFVFLVIPRRKGAYPTPPTISYTFTLGKKRHIPSATLEVVFEQYDDYDTMKDGDEPDGTVWYGFDIRTEGESRGGRRRSDRKEETEYEGSDPDTSLTLVYDWMDKQILTYKNNPSGEATAGIFLAGLIGYAIGKKR